MRWYSLAAGDAGRTPWLTNLDLGVTYRPAFADHKLAIGLQVFNVINDRDATRAEAVYGDDRFTVSNTYGMGTYFNPPRFVRLSASYDF